MAALALKRAGDIAILDRKRDEKQESRIVYGWAGWTDDMIPCTFREQMRWCTSSEKGASTTRALRLMIQS